MAEPLVEGGATPYYIVSGTLPLIASSYVERTSDRELLATLAAGEYCFVLNSRQMGKSSMAVRVMGRLKEQSIRAVFLDLQKFGGTSVTPDQWYVSLLSEIGRSLGLRRALLDFWQQHRDLTLV